MANWILSELAKMIAHRDGIVLYPKGDGRIEIPNAVVRLMGWRDKSKILIYRKPGCLVLSIDDCGVPISRVAVSMGRVRIPMSILKSVSMGRVSIIAAIDFPKSIVVRRNLEEPSRLADLEVILGEIGEDACARLMGILDGNHQGVETRLAEVHQEQCAKPRLFLMDSKRPTIVRVVGPPFAFQAHWVTDGSLGKLVAHSDGCELCTLRAPERLSLVPVIRRAGGLQTPGFLLAQEELRSKMARQLSGRNPVDFDLILYFAPFQDGMCSVHKAPPEAIPEDLVKSAQEVCSDPDRFVAESFGTGFAEGRVARAPMFIVEGHFKQ
jgi:hypothetical protein